MGKLVRLARPQFLVAGLALFLFGALVAVLLGAPLAPGRLLLGSMIVLTAQQAVNFGNDYFDVDADQPDGATFISGGSGVLLRNPELRGPVRWIITGLVLLSFGLGLVFVLLYKLPFWYMGFVALGNLAGWLYSAPPLRLSYRGLGEPVFVLVAGFLLPAMGYLTLQGGLDTRGSLLLVPLVLYGLVFILSVEIPDVEVDRLGGKRTWVARLGRRFGFVAAGLLLLGATGFFFFLARLDPPPLPIDFRMAGGFSLLPLGPGLYGLIRQPVDRQAATPVAASIVIALALFAIAMDAYLIGLILWYW